MGCRSLVLELLRNAKVSAADQALGVALARMEPAGARPVVETLLARQTREGLKSLIVGWHALDEPLREMVLARSNQVLTTLREAFSSTEEQTRINVVEVIRQARLYKAAYLLDSAMHDRSYSVRSAAAAVLCDLSAKLLDAAPVWPGSGDVPLDEQTIRRHMADLERHKQDRRHLAAALDVALTSYELHRQPGVVEAAMWFVDEMDGRLWKILLAPGNRLTRLVQGVLERGRDPRLVPFMFQALGYSEFRPVVTHLLASCTDPEFLEAFFQQSWRLAEPRAGRALAAVRELACVCDQLTEILKLSEDAQRHFSRCVMASGLGETVKFEVLKEMHRRGSPPGRRAALWAIADIKDNRCTTFLRSVAAQREPGYAWIARCELARRRPRDYSPGKLLPEGSGGLSAMDTAEAAEMTASTYWLSFDRLNEAERFRLGKQLLADGRMTPETVGEWLTNSQGADCVRALRLVALLDLAGPLQEHLYRLCHDPCPEVRSAAVTALGQVPTATSRRVLHNSLYDPDARVQANTVEALAKIGGASVAAELIPKLTSPDNRTRANAVQALLKVGVREAAETLLLMLQDENRAHRASALWLVDQMNLLPLAARVIRMAEADQDDQVRGRARSLAARITDPPAEPAAVGAGMEDAP